MDILKNAPLGNKSPAITQYDPTLLFPIPRQNKRDTMNISTPLPFTGFDSWNAYEVSWLNNQGKPLVMRVQILVPCESPSIFESKSLKLYLNSFNNSTFQSVNEVHDILIQDLSRAINHPLTLKLYDFHHDDSVAFKKFPGICIDELNTSCTDYNINPALLCTKNTHVSETIHSHLLRSNCLVTGQPDWASVLFQYEGKQIIHESLLQYIVSFRNHNDFHEQCVEQMFMDIMKNCQPQKLSIQANYARRGGINIIPFRSNQGNTLFRDIHLLRQ